MFILFLIMNVFFMNFNINAQVLQCKQQLCQCTEKKQLVIMISAQKRTEFETIYKEQTS